MRIEVEDVAGMSAALNAKQLQKAKAGRQRQEWDEMSVSDPAGNKLVFASRVPENSKKADR